MKVMCFFLPLLFLTGCDLLGPVTRKLPPETQEGADTFGALVDGVAWRPDADGQLFPLPLAASYSGLPRGLIIYAINRAEDSGFYFSQSTVIRQEGTYPLIHDSNHFWAHFRIGEKMYHPVGTDGGFITITKLDTVEIGFVSGTFFFDAVNKEDSTDIIHITDGRFDVRF
ncbi:MAG: DUF6252 family protein [Bacteroidia bacterium]|nr:DUF6252 family protein [Bacteroidia bacterium]